MTKRNILLIEDAPQVAGILISKLGREGHAVRWVRTRGGAYEVLFDKSFDLVLLSTYLLPERNAWDLLDEFAGGRIPNASKAQVLMLLESEEMHLAPEAQRRGAYGVIQKPFKPTVVAKLVRELPVPSRS